MADPITKLEHELAAARVRIAQLEASETEFRRQEAELSRERDMLRTLYGEFTGLSLF